MTNSYTQNSAKNALISLSTQAATNILGFISRCFFIRYLSVEYLGINGLFTNVLTMLSFAELGIGEALVYAMYKPMKENDEAKLKGLINFYRTAYIWIAIATIVIGFVLSFFISGFVKEKPNLPESLQVVFFLFMINNAISYLLAYKQTILTVDQKRYVVATIRQVVSLGQLVLQICFLVITRNYYVFLIWQILGTLVTNYAISIYVNRCYPWISGIKKSDILDIEDRKNIFNDIKTLSISKVAGVVSAGADNIIIARVIDLVSVGLASNYTMVVNSLNALLWGVLSSITGSIGQFNVDANTREKNKVFDQIYLLTFWLYACFCIGLMCLLSPLVVVWLGSEYVLSQSVVIALVSIIYVSGINFPFYTFRVTSGLFKPMQYNYFYFGLLNIILSVILGKRLGLVGVYISTTITRLIATEFKEGIIVYSKVLCRPRWEYFIKYFVFMLVFVIAYLAADKVLSFVCIGGWFGLIAKGILCLIVVNGIFGMVFCKSEAFKGLMNKAHALIQNRVK